MSSDDPLAEFCRLIAGIDIAMMTSAAPDGSLHSRPLARKTLSTDGTMWFLVHRGADWVPPVGQDVPVNLGFVDDGRWISASGIATSTDDPSRIATLADDRSESDFRGSATDLVALRVNVSRVDYWSSVGTLVSWFETARAAITGERPERGEHGTIETDL